MTTEQFEFIRAALLTIALQLGLLIGLLMIGRR